MLAKEKGRPGGDGESLGSWCKSDIHEGRPRRGTNWVERAALKKSWWGWWEAQSSNSHYRTPSMGQECLSTITPTSAPSHARSLARSCSGKAWLWWGSCGRFLPELCKGGWALITEGSLLKGDLNSIFLCPPPHGSHQFQSSKQARVGEIPSQISGHPIMAGGGNGGLLLTIDDYKNHKIEL